MSGEFERIAGIVEALGARASGIGDDCAVLENGKGALVVSTDLSVEGVHFRLEWLAHREVGWRAAAAALSDLAAEGATPSALLAAVMVPRAASDDELVAVMRGVGDAAAAAGALVVGGDLSSGPLWSMTITVLGHAIRPVTRSSARPGDGVWVTGLLGGARAALESWRRSEEPSPEARRAFAHPVPRISAGEWLASHGAHAMIDLSDGLGGDARHLARASGVAIELDLGAVPFADVCIDEARRLGVPPRQFAAEGGEDYELLVALPQEFHSSAAEAFVRECGAALTRVGTVVQGSGLHTSLDGHPVRLMGFDHFR
ncbi:MAG: thiamine-phosphate kinase [Gemmatimonadales bacterium]